MSVDISLRSSSTLVRHKNVLTRAERIARLKEEERWDDINKVLGMPKVGNRKPKSGAKKKAKGPDAEEAKK
ncbi:MAG: small basic protein [Phycisphaerae bacterium]